MSPLRNRLATATCSISTAAPTCRAHPCSIVISSGGSPPRRGPASPSSITGWRPNIRFRRRSMMRSSPTAGCLSDGADPRRMSIAGESSGGGTCVVGIAAAARRRHAAAGRRRGAVAVDRPGVDRPVTARQCQVRSDDPQRRGAASRRPVSRRGRSAHALCFAALWRSDRPAADADPGRQRRGLARRTRCVWRSGCATPAVMSKSKYGPACRTLGSSGRASFRRPTWRSPASACSSRASARRPEIGSYP